jgi:hypothetical protein
MTITTCYENGSGCSLAMFKSSLCFYDEIDTLGTSRSMIFQPEKHSHQQLATRPQPDQSLALRSVQTAFAEANVYFRISQSPKSFR